MTNPRDIVLLERGEAGVRVITLNDPDRRNAIGPDMQAELGHRIRETASDRDARVLIVKGKGPAFCAGADLPAVFGDNTRSTDAIHRDLREYYRCFLSLLDLSIPTIAVVHGPAIGAGLNLALCCDIRLVGPNGQFGATFTRIGLHPGGGCTFFLVRAMGAQRALRILLLGETLDAFAAVENRLADALVDDPKAAALELAADLARVDPELARNVKISVRLAANGDFESVLDFEARAQAVSAKGPALQRALERFRPRT